MAVDVGKLTGAALKEWYGRSTQEIEEEKRRALEAGRRVWNDGTRAGTKVLARTESELAALGRSELARQALEAGGQGGAVARAAANRMTFGYADRFSAAADAAIGFGEGETFRDRYRSNLGLEAQRTQYDARHRPVAKAVGDVAGEVIAFKGVGGAGVSAVRRLPPKAKGVVGEVLSAGKTVLRGDLPVGFRRPLTVKGGRTIRDHVTLRGGSVEAKFGPTARLSPRQREAQEELGSLYRVDRWQPHHVGRITGGAGAVGVGLYDDDDVR